ncbi:MAG TPA: FTR1 family protein [Roseiflexaceae bacterium]|nr:FTR1 family protein [Roseiflexaceae bacterium]
MKAILRCIAVLLMLVGLASATLAHAQERTLADQVRDLTNHAEEGMDAAERNRPELMRGEYAEIHAIWESFEDQVSARDAAGYAEIEAALAAIKAAVDAQPPDPAAVKVAYAHLQDEAGEVADRLAGTAATPAKAPSNISLPEALQHLEAADTALARGDTAAAAAEVTSFIRVWPAVEGAVATKSGAAYTTVEAELGRAHVALDAQPADAAAAQAAVARMRAALAPLAGAQSYTAFDAGAIILREGLEALLVIVALLAFLQKSGNADKRGWVWAGGALGVGASIVTAIVLQTIFSSISAGQNRELLEGGISLVAALLLFYVSYWLHSKASLHAWQKYISARTSQALARGSMAGLALLAFLAVFREGAETTVFYLGMARAIATADLVLGIGVGAGILIVAAVLILVLGVRLPLRPFFRVAGLLVYYLGFKFVGAGLHALQIAGVIPSTPIANMPSSAVLEFFGIYPTWQTLLPQLALLLGALAAWSYLRAQDQRALSAAAAA